MSHASNLYMVSEPIKYLLLGFCTAILHVCWVRAWGGVLKIPPL